jgi:hypothetical protein
MWYFEQQTRRGNKYPVTVTVTVTVGRRYHGIFLLHDSAFNQLNIALCWDHF